VRKVVLIPILAAAIVGVAVVAGAVWRQADAGPPIQTKALGVWQEQTASQPVRMTVSAGDVADDGAPRFWVDLPASPDPPLPARLEGDAIVVYKESDADIVWRITYDDGADVLLLTRPDGSQRHVLRRVSR
jgi:hypothetical protein